MTTHPSIFAGKPLWPKEPGRLWSMESQELDMTEVTEPVRTHQHVVCAAAAESLPSCPTLCDPIDGSPPGSPVPGILQARTLEWVAISFSNA